MANANDNPTRVRAASAWLKRKWLQRTQPLASALLEKVSNGRAVPEVQALLREELDKRGVEAACAAIDESIRHATLFGADRRACRTLYTAAIRAVSFADVQRAIDLGERHIALATPQSKHSLVIFHRKVGNYERALALLEDLPRDEWYETTKAGLLRWHDVQRLQRMFGDELRAAQALGDERVVEVAERVFAAAEEGSKLPAYLMLRAVLGSSFRVNPRLAHLTTEHADGLVGLDEEHLQIASIVSDHHLHFGRLGKAHEVVVRLFGDHPKLAARRAKLGSLNRLLRDGFVHQFDAADAGEPYRPLAGRVLMSLHNSLPYDSGGYAARSHGLLSGLVRRGWDMSGVTRAGYPQDMVMHRDKPLDPVSRVGEVSYFRLPGTDAVHGGDLHAYLGGFIDRLLALARAERPEILHACSNHTIGVAVNAVARKLGIKSIYEVRGLWEITRISRQPDWEGSEYHQLMSRMEVQAAQDADAVICITNALKAEMVRRGVPAEKITIVPNGVDVDRFVPRARNAELAGRLGLTGKKVIGYLGTIVGYEGLDLLLRAIVLLRERGVDGFGALIVGDGAALPELRQLAVDLGVTDLVTFTGRVPHEEVEDYYSIVDVAPFPRRSLPVTEMVSPLKPFEAMAMDKVVIASNVAALAEIVQDGVNGFLFQKDSVPDLADKLEKALHPGFEHTLEPRKWVVANRSWQHLSSIVDGLYKRLTNRLQPAPQIHLNRITLAPDVEQVLAAYQEKYDTDGKDYLRRDDYARWSHVSRMVQGETSLLDVGVGIGQFINAMASRGAFQRLVGVDISKHSKFLRLHDSFTMDYVSIADLPYADGEFDVVTCMETIEHLPEAIFAAGVAQLRRVCRKRLIVTVPFREEVLSKGHVRRFDFADVERLFPRGEVTLFRREKVKKPPSFWALVEERF